MIWDEGLLADSPGNNKSSTYHQNKHRRECKFLLCSGGARAQPAAHLIINFSADKADSKDPN